jgi:hypothetical protein
MFRRLEKEKLRTKNNIDWEYFTFHYKNNEIKIDIQDLYPFKPPILLIHNKDHIEWFLKEYVQLNDFLKKFRITNDCICCRTMICSWVPTYTIDQVLNEYKLYYDKYEILKSMQLLYKQQLFDDLIYQTIFLYIDI